MALGFCKAEMKPGPAQAKVLPAAAGPPLSVTEGVVQDMIPVVAAVAPGGVLFNVTVVVAVAVQPLTLLVTVTV